MNLFKKLGQKLGFIPTKNEEPSPTAPVLQERMPTGNSNYTASTNTPAKKKSRRKRRLENQARNKQHSNK